MSTKKEPVTNPQVNPIDEAVKQFNNLTKDRLQKAAMYRAILEVKALLKGK